MNRSLQLSGLWALTGLASLLLVLIGVAFGIMGYHIGEDGRVPAAEAFGLTALLLSFREVIGSIRALYDHEDRANLTDKLAASTPSAEIVAPASAADAGSAADAVAGAAQGEADRINDQ
jgi:hypothetical protein